MSIASRITTMTEHIDDIYDTVELTGVDTTGVNKNLVNVPNTLKDGFVDIINNGVDTLYENFPKVAQTGEEPTLNGVYEAPMRVDLNGNTEQDSYSGKNLLPNYKISREVIGVTFTPNEDGTYLINGKNTSTTQNAFVNIYVGDYYLPSGTYYCIPTGDTQVTVTLSAIYEDDTTQYIDATNPNGAFTINKNIKYATIYIQVRKETETTYNNFKVYPIISTTPVTTDTYEPYVGGTASPNPDYPQDIRVVKGNNTIKVTDELKDSNKIINAYLNTSEGVHSNNNNRVAYIPINNNTTYTITKILSNRFRIGLTDVLPDGNNNAIYDYQNVDNQESYSFTNTNHKYLCIWFWNDNDTLTEQEIFNNMSIYSNIQTYPLDLDDIELCKIGDYKDEIRKSTGKNIITTYNYASSGYINYNYDNSKIGKTMTYSFIPNFSTTNATLYIRANTSISSYNVGTISTITSGTKVSVTFTLTDEQYNTIKNTTGGYIQVYKSEVPMDENSISNPMLEENNQATDYEPFGKVWYLKKNIGKVVLDGSEDESWSYNSGNEVFVSNDLVNYILGIFTPFCNYYTGKPSITGYSQIPNNCIAFLNSSTNNRLVVKNTTYNTASNFKTWLSNNNTIVYYVLATPTYTEITDTTLIEQLEDLKTAKSVEGQTNITQTNEELPFILDVSGLKKD